MKKVLPIGNDSFLTIRENNWYYIDKTLMIKDFIEYQDTVALITRPRRFGKTINMTMLREFFDITKDSRTMFDGLQIMNTKYAKHINSRPIIFFSFKDCTGRTKEELKLSLMKELLKEYVRYSILFDNNIDKSDVYVKIFYNNLLVLQNQSASLSEIRFFLEEIIRVVYSFYKITPILLIDEYDQPILSSYENGYREELRDFFSVLYGSALKGNEYLGQALLTGIQRVAKESIFSKLNNMIVYTVTDEHYAKYFGITKEETNDLLEIFDLKLTNEVKQQYDGYIFGGIEMYNPWSILNYASRKKLDCYWVNTSTNYLVREALKSADENFMEEYYQLIETGCIEVGVKLDTSFIELANGYTLWGLMINSGYLTITNNDDNLLKWVRIPNDEVKSEFLSIIAEQANMEASDLEKMFKYLLNQDLKNFIKVYQSLILSCTSYHDAKENAYHMLFLGMCISLSKIYKISSNIESGHGRHDIRLESLSKERFHIIIEFKQGENITKLKEEALQQILNQKYYVGLTGKVLCLGIAHDTKKCEMVYSMIEV